MFGQHRQAHTRLYRLLDCLITAQFKPDNRFESELFEMRITRQASA